MKIEIIEHCFGPDVRVDNVSLFDDGILQQEEVFSAQEKLLNELSKIKDKLDMRDWTSIADILVCRNTKFEIEDSNESNCDQCGNNNYRTTYKIKDDE